MLNENEFNRLFLKRRRYNFSILLKQKINTKRKYTTNLLFISYMFLDIYLLKFKYNFLRNFQNLENVTYVVFSIFWVVILNFYIIFYIIFDIPNFLLYFSLSSVYPMRCKNRFYNIMDEFSKKIKIRKNEKYKGLNKPYIIYLITLKE